MYTICVCVYYIQCILCIHLLVTIETAPGSRPLERGGGFRQNGYFLVCCKSCDTQLSVRGGSQDQKWDLEAEWPFRREREKGQAGSKQAGWCSHSTGKKQSTLQTSLSPPQPAHTPYRTQYPSLQKLTCCKPREVFMAT